MGLTWDDPRPVRFEQGQRSNLVRGVINALWIELAVLGALFTVAALGTWWALL